MPASVAHTIVIDAGAVAFGVEYRHLDEEAILAAYGPDARAKFGNVRPAGMAEVVTEDGLCIHVWDAGTAEERLRFDCFDDAPHWHLLDPGPPRNVVVEHDPAAGPLLDWALERLGADLPALLAEAGAEGLAARVDPDRVAGAVGTLGQAARYVLAAGAPVVTSSPGGRP